MKRYSAVLFATLVFFSLPATGARAESFPMICRGGGSLRVQTLAQFFPVKGSMAPALQPSIDVFFTKARTASGQQGENLGPGECAWLDRPINAGEPSSFADQSALGVGFYMMSVATSAGNGTPTISSSYSELALPGGEKHFVFVNVGRTGAGPFFRDAAQPVKFTTKP
jgi:hypothetical protein